MSEATNKLAELLTKARAAKKTREAIGIKPPMSLEKLVKRPTTTIIVKPKNTIQPTIRIKIADNDGMGTKTIEEITSVVSHQTPQDDIPTDDLPIIEETPEGIIIHMDDGTVKAYHTQPPDEFEPEEKSVLGTTTDQKGNLITYNELQDKFVNLASTGKNCILIGAAGTGKTTGMQGTLRNLIDSGAAGVLRYVDHKYMVDGTPGILIISYTRRAVNNIRRSVSEDMKHNCITSHKMLEYQPQFYTVFDETTGKERQTMSFEPSRHQGNPLPNSIKTIVVEEASMLSLQLYSQLIDALSHKIQWILLGDLNQLPPVFGSAILGYKLLQWPVIELTEVYRQALESPIIRLAHRVLSGKPIPVEEFDGWHVENELTIHSWKKKLSGDNAVRTLAAFFKSGIDKNVYLPDDDIILMPFNEACGTLELNRHIANHLARRDNKTTYEILAGFNKIYLSAGDRVLYDKEDAEILEIKSNMSYTGGRVQPESKTLDYWGYNPNLGKESYDMGDKNIDDLLEDITESDDRVRQASHVITLRIFDNDEQISVSSAADINSMIHGYAITVHKAQGSEWDRVFLCLHQSHATMLQRELLYTAITRAKKELYVICEPDSFVKGIKSQKIKGNTLAEKAEFFKGKMENSDTELLAYILK